MNWTKLYEMQGRDDEARKRYEVITEDFPKTAASAESYFALGTAALDEEKDYPLARKYFDNVEREFRESTYAPSARVRVQEIDDLLSVSEAIEKVEVSLFGEGEIKEETEKISDFCRQALECGLRVFGEARRRDRKYYQ